MAALIKAIQREIRRDQETLRRKREVLRDPEVRATLTALGKALKGQQHVSVSCYYGRPYVRIDLLELDSFKVGPVPDLLGKLINLGVEFTSSADCGSIGNREYAGHFGRADIRVEATLSEASKQCSVRKIETTVTKVETSYVIECGEEVASC